MYVLNIVSVYRNHTMVHMYPAYMQSTSIYDLPVNVKPFHFHPTPFVTVWLLTVNFSWCMDWRIVNASPNIKQSRVFVGYLLHAIHAMYDFV